jgi:hypothetical protein
MRPRLVVIGLLLVASSAWAGEVKILFSGTSAAGAFSGWLSYQKPLPAVSYVGSPTQYASYLVDAPGQSFMDWEVTIGGTTHAPVASTFHRDSIQVFDGTDGSGADGVSFFAGHLGGTNDVLKKSLTLRFRDTDGVLIGGWDVPEPLPTSGWESSFMNLQAWDGQQVSLIVGTITDVTVVPLPPAVWAGLLLLAILALRRRLHRAHST